MGGGGWGVEFWVDTVARDSFTEGTLGGLFIDASGVSGEKNGLLAWKVVIGPGDGVVTVDRGLPVLTENREEGAGDDEMTDSSPNDSRGGVHGGRCDRSECGIFMDRLFPCVGCVGGALSCRGWTAAIAGMLELPAVSAGLTPRYGEIGRFASLGGTYQFMSKFVTGPRDILT